MLKRQGINIDAWRMLSETADATPTAPQSHEVTTAASHEAELFNLYENGYPKALSTGWPTLDEAFRIRPGEFTVVTGIPGHGKSSWLDNLMIHSAKTHGWRWGVFSAENYPVSRHISGLCEIYSGLPFMKGPNRRMSKTNLDLCLKFIEQHFSFLQPTENSFSLNRIVELAAQIPELDALLIDPWNELDHAKPPDMREDQHISISLSKLRWLARSAQIHVFVVCHPAKYLRKPGEPKPVITLNECKGASEWYAKADNGLSIWRDETDRTGAAHVYVQKVRFRDVGIAGADVTLYYDRVNGRYRDPAVPFSIDHEITSGTFNYDSDGEMGGRE